MSDARPPITNRGSNDPLHGLTLETILTRLLERHGWQGLARHIDVRCFQLDPSIKSSLTFLRRTPWARKMVEQLYLAGLADRRDGDRQDGDRQDGDRQDGDRQGGEGQGGA